MQAGQEARTKKLGNYREKKKKKNPQDIGTHSI